MSGNVAHRTKKHTQKTQYTQVLTEEERKKEKSNNNNNNKTSATYCYINHYMMTTVLQNYYTDQMTKRYVNIH